MSTRADRSQPQSGLPQAAGGTLIAGKYRLERELGRGGMGAVYAARHAVTGRQFAVKLLGRELRGDARAEARFLREATLASAIQHPAIVEVYDVGCDRGQPYMVMRLVQGETLSQRLERGVLTPGEAIALLLPVVDAVAAAHACGIVHRDLKPDNVMIERDGDKELPRVLDFGISKLMSSEARTRITHPGALIGTPDYMAPEQVRGEPNLDARTDIYSLGVMLYEMLTGSLPYAADAWPALLRKIVRGGAPGVRALRPELAVGLEAVVARAMALAPEVRHRDAAELARDLAPFAAAPSVERAHSGQAARTPDSVSPLTTTIAGGTTLPPRARLYAAAISALFGLGLLMAGPAWRAPRTPPATTGAAAASGAVLASEAAAAPHRVASEHRAPAQPDAAGPALAPAPPLAAVRTTPRSTPAGAAGERAQRKARRARELRRADAGLAAAHADPAAPEPAAMMLPSVTSELLDPFH